MHTDARSRARAPASVSHARNGASSTSVRVPGPPGTRRMSIGSLESSRNERPHSTRRPCALETRPASGPTKSSVMPSTWLKSSTGPHTSSSSNASKSTTLTCLVIDYSPLRCAGRITSISTLVEIPSTVPSKRSCHTAQRSSLGRDDSEKSQVGRPSACGRS